MRDDFHKIMRAFRALDPDGKGFIELDVLKKGLLTRGEVFSTEEMQSCQTALDIMGGKVYYEDYAHKLAASGRGA